MRNYRCLFLLLMLSCTAFPQSKVLFFSEKPFNKGFFVLSLGYEKQPENNVRSEAPKLCLDIGYGFTDWCVAGLYANYGRSFGYEATSVCNKNDAGQMVDVYGMEYRSNYLEYGAQAKLHPLSPLLPGFYLIDVYALVRVGMHHYLCSVLNEWGDDSFREWCPSELKNTGLPCVAGGCGVAVNPSKHFGLFYELAYNNIDKEYNSAEGKMKAKSIHRFGLNIRFGGPKKWRQGQ